MAASPWKKSVMTCKQQKIISKRRTKRIPLNNNYNHKNASHNLSCGCSCGDNRIIFNNSNVPHIIRQTTNVTPPPRGWWLSTEQIRKTQHIAVQNRVVQVCWPLSMAMLDNNHYDDDDRQKCVWMRILGHFDFNDLGMLINALTVCFANDHVSSSIGCGFEQKCGLCDDSHQKWINCNIVAIANKFGQYILGLIYD